MGLSHYIIGTLSLTSFAVSSLGQTTSPTNGIMAVDSVVTHVKKTDVPEHDSFGLDSLSASDISMMMKKETSKSFKKQENDLKLEREAKEKAEKEKTEKEKAEREQAEREQAEREQAEREEQERLEAEEQARLEQEQEESLVDESTDDDVNQASNTPVSYGGIEFDGNGLLVESTSGTAEQVISLLLSIPGHSNGSGYHASTGLDNLIDQLSTPEAVHVIHRIEGAGFGQTGGGYAGYDSPESHQAFVNQQVNNRFGGSVHSLLKAWGTFSYGGY